MSLQPSHPLALSCGSFLFLCSELLCTGIRESLGTVTLQVTQALSVLPSPFSSQVFPLFCFF